jgi:hypothetical protein
MLTTHWLRALLFNAYAGIVLPRGGCAFAAFAIEMGVGLLYFVWVLAKTF